MQVKHPRTGQIKTVAERYQKILVKMGWLPVEQTYQTTAMKPEISTRTGKPKRQYKRRDMQASEEE